jgi:hypothetical protein
VYLAIFSTSLTILSLLFLIAIPENILTFDWRGRIFLSLFSTVLTVIFLSIFLALREEREWRAVKDNVYRRIETELTLLFSEIMRFTEGELAYLSFHNKVISKRDIESEKQLVGSKLSELKNQKNLSLNEEYLKDFFSKPEMVHLLEEVNNNLSNLQITYGKHLNSTITESIMKVQDAIEFIVKTFEMDLQLKKDTFEMKLLNQLLLDANTAFTTQFRHGPVLGSVKMIINEMSKMWEKGIRFR